jgi:hypothetical protein
MARILIATSIAPGGRIATQRNAIESWLSAGFDVVSLNAKDEIAALQGDFPNTTFVSVERTAKLLTGRHHVFIDDILHYLAKSGTGTVGIVNSDIVLASLPGLAERIAEQAAHGLLCCPRLDVAQGSDGGRSVDPFGYDLFFFRPETAVLWDRTRLCLGQGYWDHYLPLMAILRGHPTFKVLPPIGRHIAHDINRDDNFFLFADEFAALASGFMAGAHPASDDWTKFGQGFPKHAYAETRQAAESGRPEDIEAFARHIDALTRYVIRFIDANCRRVSLGG